MFEQRAGFSLLCLCELYKSNWERFFRMPQNLANIAI